MDKLHQICQELCYRFDDRVFDCIANQTEEKPFGDFAILNGDDRTHGPLAAHLQAHTNGIGPLTPWE